MWQCDAEPVCHAVGVVEVGGDLAGIVDLAVRQAHHAEVGGVTLVDSTRIECELFGEPAECAGARRETVGRDLAGDSVRQLEVGLLGTEQLCVLGESVRRAVHRANGNRDRAALGH